MTDGAGAAHKGRRTPVEIEQVVGAFAGSGLNRSQFCRREGLTLGTLNRYLKRASAATAGRSEVGLVAVECNRESNPMRWGSVF